MRGDLSAATTAALGGQALLPRDFLWITARTRGTGTPVTWGAWSDVGKIDAGVLDADGVSSTRTFEGAGSLIKTSAVRMVTGLEVQTVSIQLSQVSPYAEQLVRTHDVRRARVELFRGYLSPQTYQLVDPALCVFDGFVDAAPIATPEEGGEGNITLTCASHAQELTSSSAAPRSDADQRRRNAADAFYTHVATVGSWKPIWGGK
jgi:hypothetical protein